MKILIIGDTDIDGTGAATIINWYHQCKQLSFKPQIKTWFPSRGVLNKIFEQKAFVEGAKNSFDLIYLCDTGLNSAIGNKHLGEILAPKTVYFDHHETNLKNQESYKDNFKGFYVKEGARCTAKIAYDVLAKRLEPAPESLNILAAHKYKKFIQIKEFSHLVNDYDLWIRKYPRSTELADVVRQLGPARAYEEFLTIALKPHNNTDRMKAAIEIAEEQKKDSLELGKATLVKHKNYKTPFYTAIINGSRTDVGADLVHPRGMIAVLDIEEGTISFRIGSEYSGMKYSRNKTLNCLDFAEIFGGGGHPQAAGIAPEGARIILKEMSQEMGRFLLETEKENRQNKKIKPKEEEEKKDGG